MDDRFESSRTYDMITGQDPLGKLCIIVNVNDKIFTLDTDTIPMKDREALYHLKSPD